jgi:hypothetical protein
MPEAQGQTQKKAFRTIVGVVMIFLFFFPPSMMIFGSGPVRTPIWNLRLAEAAAVAVDTTAEPTPQPGASPSIEIIGVPSSGRREWVGHQSVGRASPPASPGGLFSSDRSDKPGDRPTPIDLSAMIREQLLILLTASALWLALFGMPRSVTKTESTQ